jgi:hypothetical protein
MRKLCGTIAVLAAVAGGCGSDEPAPSAGTPAANEAAPEPAATVQGFEPGHSEAVREFYGGDEGVPADPNSDVEAEFHQPPRPAVGGIGDTITLTGLNIGVRIDVTLTRLVDPAETARPPRRGMRYVGVALRMVSTGGANHESRLVSARLRYGGRAAEPVFGVEAKCSRGFDGVVVVEVGRRARGCLLLQVPERARLREFTLALEQLAAAVGGRWRLR